MAQTKASSKAPARKGATKKKASSKKTQAPNWTKKEDSLFFKGLRNKDIAEKTGRTLSAVASRRTNLNKRGEDASGSEEPRGEDRKKVEGKKGVVRTAAKKSGTTERNKAKNGTNLTVQPAKAVQQQKDIPQGFNGTVMISVDGATLVFNPSKWDSVKVSDGSVKLVTREALLEEFFAS